MAISPDKLQTSMESAITAMLPTISENLKARIKDELKKQFDNGSQDVKNTTTSSLKELSSKETQILATIKGELKDIQDEISVAGADALKVATKNLGELADKLGVDPKFKSIILSLPQIRDDIVSGLKDAQSKIDELKKLKSEKVKDNHAITISAVNLILGIIITAVTVLSTIVGLIMTLRGG
jgi:hypothetical protein